MISLRIKYHPGQVRAVSGERCLQGRAQPHPQPPHRTKRIALVQSLTMVELAVEHTAPKTPKQSEHTQTVIAGYDQWRTPRCYRVGIADRPI